MWLNKFCKSVEFTSQADKFICSNTITNYPEFKRALFLGFFLYGKIL